MLTLGFCGAGTNWLCPGQGLRRCSHVEAVATTDDSFGATATVAGVVASSAKLGGRRPMTREGPEWTRVAIQAPMRSAVCGLPAARIGAAPRKLILASLSPSPLLLPTINSFSHRRSQFTGFVHDARRQKLLRCSPVPAVRPRGAQLRGPRFAGIDGPTPFCPEKY